MSQTKDAEKKLVADIAKNRKTGAVSTATLRTDDRVLARITDGIYRQPASALRELISNAYDADATSVIIQTDAPRFKQITVRDDGNGMDVATLARLIHHIGGSTKRRADGASFGVTNKRDPSLSPKGRRLIGKIGIGLFSVAQLTRHFQIVTKVKGKDYRLVAEVILRTYSEDEQRTNDRRKGGTVETGTVRIVSVPAEDVSAQGTEIILMDLRPQAIELLRSRERWESIGAGPLDSQGIISEVRVPTFHIGELDPKEETITRAPALPWSKDDNPADRFRRLYQGIVDTVGTTEQNPKLETTLDNYLRMLWTLSLAAPLNYIDGHPFDICGKDGLEVFQLHPSVPGQASPLELKRDETVRQRCELKAPERGASETPFRVLVDEIELFRPIRFSDLPATAQALKEPMLFVGSASPDLSRISEQERGGQLAFEAYFLWAPKIVPKENNGLLIRIGDASGTLFDESFAKYQVSEQTRLRQLTAEVFVKQGLDAALNIDRESFNTTHPHYQFIMRWVHRALRQLMNTLKQRAADIRTGSLEQDQAATKQALERVVDAEVAKAAGTSRAGRSVIELSVEGTKAIEAARRSGKLALNPARIFEPLPKPKRARKKSQGNQDLFKQQIKAVAQVLDAYGLLEDLNYEQQEELLRAIVAIFSVDRGS